jgi:ribosomal protein L10
VKIRQLTQATVKDLKNKIKEKNAEIEVLKEMVKSSNI